MRISRAGAALAGMCGVGCFVVVVVALHLLPTGLDPVRRTVSEYVNQPFGWLVPIAGAGMGLGSAAIALALARAGVPHRAGLVVWSVAMLVVAAFPADPAPRLGTVAWTPAGVVHVVAGAIAFLSLAVAAPLISRAVPSRAVRILGVAAPLGLLLFVITLVNRPPVARLIGEPVAHGLGERVMVAIYAAWLISVAWWVRRERS